jgi:hypothetical protein
MVFQGNDWKKYITGELFSNGVTFELNKDNPHSEDRLNCLEQVAKDYRIIHFGCADHVGLISKKIKEKKWLHDRLALVSSRCVGLDQNVEALKYISEELGRQDCYKYILGEDKLPEVIVKNHWDILIMGEILEHVDNPVSFLKTIKEIFSPFCDRLVITVPNAFSFENMVFSLKNKECINTDHRYWFTPYTINKVGGHAGLKTNSMLMCGSLVGRSWFYRYMVNRVPMLRDTIISGFDMI